MRKPGDTAVHLGTVGTAMTQFVIAIYGGYFGGGIGFLMMAALTMAGLTIRQAGATKNALAGVMNASAVVLGAGAVIGGLVGSAALHRINERVLRIAIVCIGICLTIGLFLKPI